MGESVCVWITNSVGVCVVVDKQNKTKGFVTSATAAARKLQEFGHGAVQELGHGAAGLWRVNKRESLAAGMHVFIHLHACICICLNMYVCVYIYIECVCIYLYI